MSERVKNPDAVMLGARGGRKGGLAAAASLTPKERTARARNAAHKRWNTQPPAPTMHDIAEWLKERLEALDREIPALEQEREVVQSVLAYYHNRTAREEGMQVFTLPPDARFTGVDGNGYTSPPTT